MFTLNNSIFILLLVVVEEVLNLDLTREESHWDENLFTTILAIFAQSTDTQRASGPISVTPAHVSGSVPGLGSLSLLMFSETQTLQLLDACKINPA